MTWKYGMYSDLFYYNVLYCLFVCLFYSLENSESWTIKLLQFSQDHCSSHLKVLQVGADLSYITQTS